MNEVLTPILARVTRGTELLPHNRIGRISSGLGGGETCDACETSITKEQLVTEVALAGGRGGRGTVSFHALCFQLWDAERKEPRA